MRRAWKDNAPAWRLVAAPHGAVRRDNLRVHAPRSAMTIAEPSAPPRAHHLPGGGFRNPWLDRESRFRDFLRWRAENVKSPPPRAPRRPVALPRAEPAFSSPRAPADAISVTWIGHSTMLVQAGAVNILTDPIWSAAAGPMSWLGPRRYTAPGMPIDALPPIDLVLLSHDHYDHLDDVSVRRIAAAHPGAHWVTSLGVAPLLRARGVQRATELDWWDSIEAAGVRVTGTPAQHFSGRTPFDRMRRLWSGFAVEAGAHSIYFVGDSGYSPGFEEVGRRLGPFDITLMPIGAYEPRWFMAPMHIDPADAVRAFGEVNRGVAPGAVMVGMHWGTFRLTDEPVDEPPALARRAWEGSGRRAEDLWILPHGGTRWR